MSNLKTNRLWPIAALVFGCLGCHSVGDPACDVREELTAVGCRDLFLHPDLDLTGVTQVPWFRCAPGWFPQCGSAFCNPRAARHLPATDVIFAVPASAERDE